jgi:hypothetical protein
MSQPRFESITFECTSEAVSLSLSLSLYTHIIWEMRTGRRLLCSPTSVRKIQDQAPSKLPTADWVHLAPNTVPGEHNNGPSGSIKVYIYIIYMTRYRSPFLMLDRLQQFLLDEHIFLRRILYSWLSTVLESRTRGNLKTKFIRNAYFHSSHSKCLVVSKRRPGS